MNIVIKIVCLYICDYELLKGFHRKKKKWAWRDGSAVRSTHCSSRGPEFNSQQPHGDSQPSVIGSDTL